MKVQALAARQDGQALIVTTSAGGEEREWSFAAQPPAPPTAEMLADWRGSGAAVEIGPEGPAKALSPEEWVQNCAVEAVLLHLAAQPETSIDLTHLLGPPRRET